MLSSAPSLKSHQFSISLSPSQNSHSEVDSSCSLLSRDLHGVLSSLQSHTARTPLCAVLSVWEVVSFAIQECFRMIEEIRLARVGGNLTINFRPPQPHLAQAKVWHSIWAMQTVSWPVGYLDILGMVQGGRGVKREAAIPPLSCPMS